MKVTVKPIGIGALRTILQVVEDFEVSGPSRL